MRRSYVTNAIQLGSDQLGRGEMDCVERAHDTRIEHAGRVEQTVVEADEVDAAQNAPRTIHGCGSDVANRTQDFRARERAGYRSRRGRRARRMRKGVT